MQKRGQITFYVVIGIFILAMIVMVIAFRNQIFKTEWDKERIKSLEIPEQARVVQKIILDCVGDISEEGILRISSQGGYIDLPQDTMPQTPANRFSNSLQVLPGADVRAAYWSYVAANKVPKNQIPTIESMQDELASYIDNNLARCVTNLTAGNQYEIIVGKSFTTAEIEESRVKYTVDFPVHVALSDFEFNFPAFYYEQNSKLGSLYAKAKELQAGLDENSYLEEKTLDALSVYESIPFSGTDTSCTPKIWLKPNVEKEIKKALSLNIPFIKVSGTSFTPGNRYYIADLLDGSNKNLKVKFDYFESWPFYMDVFPSDGIVMKTEPILPRNIKELAYLSSLLCITDYRFIYDLKFPVLVTLQDGNDVFQFAYMSVIDNNQPKEDKLSEDLDPNLNLICGSLSSSQSVSVIEAAGTGSVIPSENANIIFKCASAVCDIGNTGTGSPKGVLNSLFPQCVNGFVSAEKEGYVSSKEQVDTVESNNQFTVRLQKLKSVKVNIILVEDGFERNPAANEAATVTLINDESGYSTTITSEDNSAQLIPGNYKASSMVIASSDSGFEIPGRDITRCVKVPVKGITGIFGAEEEKCFTASTESISLDNVIIGGSEQEFIIPQDLYDSNEITFYVPVSGIPSTPEQLSGVIESIDIGANSRPPRLA